VPSLESSRQSKQGSVTQIPWLQCNCILCHWYPIM